MIWKGEWNMGKVTIRYTDYFTQTIQTIFNAARRSGSDVAPPRRLGQPFCQQPCFEAGAPASVQA